MPVYNKKRQYEKKSYASSVKYTPAEITAMATTAVNNIDTYYNEIQPNKTPKTHTLHKRIHLYGHDNTITEWNLESYEHLFAIADTYVLWYVINNIAKFKIKMSGYYMMKHNHKPMYEDMPDGCRIALSAYISDDNIAMKIFGILIAHMAVNDIFNNRDIDSHVCGISITAKSTFINYRIWFDCDIDETHISTMFTPILAKVFIVSLRAKVVKQLNK